LQKIKYSKILLTTLAHKCHKNLWCHMKLFSIERKHWTLFRNMYTSTLDKIQKEFFSKVGDILIFYHVVSTGKLDFKNSIWRLIHIRIISYNMSSVDLTANISQWKTCYIIIRMWYIPSQIDNKNLIILYLVFTTGKTILCITDSIVYNRSALHRCGQNKPKI
jgi:hypothetical protein